MISDSIGLSDPSSLKLLLTVCCCWTLLLVRSPTGVPSLVDSLDSSSTECESEGSDSCNPIRSEADDCRMSRDITERDTLYLDTTSALLASPDGVSESLVTQSSESPNSPPFCRQGSCSSLGLGCELVRSTGDESQALNLFEHGLGWTQGQLIISHVTAGSIMCNEISSRPSP